VDNGPPTAEGFQRDPVSHRGILGEACRVVPEAPGDLGERVSRFTGDETPVAVLDDHTGRDEALDTMRLEKSCEMIIPSEFHEVHWPCSLCRRSCSLHLWAVASRS